jgi:putative lipoprotein
MDQKDQSTYSHFNHEIIRKAGVKCMFMRKIFILIILSATVALAGCGSSTNKAAVTGVIAHTHPMTLPVGYVVTVQIEDTTKADAPGKKIAEQVIKSQGEELPMPFEVVYDPGKTNASHTYSVRVKIEDSAGKMLYTNNTSVLVITNGNPTQNVDVIVVLVNG